MQKILFIAYQFPPRGGPGVHRSLNFVRFLNEFGYDPVILTVDENDINKSGHQLDRSLLVQVPVSVRVVRTPSHEPVGFIRFLQKIRLYRFAWFFFYHNFWEWSARWPKRTFNTAVELIKEHDIKLVYTSSGPFSSMLLGRALQKKLGVKWVADLRDPFTDAYSWQFPSKFHWRNRRRFEKKLFGFPDKLIVNTPAVKELYLQRNITAPEKLICITNGF